jgi:Nif-specific regulatory protein
MPIRLPSLAERAEDLELLAVDLAASAAVRHGLPHLPLSVGALAAVRVASWPGNVRQLRNQIEAAAIRAAGEGASAIERRHVFPDETGSTDEPVSLQDAARHFQREFLRRTLEDTDWNVSEASRRLDVARSHVYTLLKAHGLSRSGSQ